MRLLPRMLELQPETARRLPGAGEVPGRGARARSRSSRRDTRTRAAASSSSPATSRAPGLGIEAAKAAELRRSLWQAWHLAAVYDLAVARELGRRVNVDGHAQRARVRGRRPGLRAAPVRLDRVRLGHRARRLPRDRPGRRPGLQEPLRGDQVPGRGRGGPLARCPRRSTARASSSGTRRPARPPSSTGPYLVLRLMERLPSPASSSASGSAAAPSTSCRSTSSWRRWRRLAATRASRGRTYHLCDPQPHSPVELTRDVRARRRAGASCSCRCRSAVARACFAPRRRPALLRHAAAGARLLPRHGAARHHAGEPRPRRARHRVPAPRRLPAAARRLLPRPPRRACGSEADDAERSRP